MKKLAIWFASLSLLGLCAATPVLATNYAVCVGVNTYNSSYCSNPLNGCVPDAQHMTNLITARGEWTAGNVTFLSNSGATLTKIRQAVSNVAKKAVSGDHFLYYHSSHGGNDVYYFTTSGGKQYLHYGLDSTGVSNYICSYNADYTAKMMATDLAAFPSGVKIVVMMDTCHSAGMFKYNATTSSRKALAAKLAEAQTASAEDDAAVEEPAPENSVSGFFMEAVLDQLAQVEAEQVRRGLRPRSAKSLATDVGWIAAADYDQYSWDGDSGGAFTEAFINGVTNQNKMCDNATYGNQDGYASFYEGWNYAKDIARGQRDYSAWDYDSNAGYYDYIWTDAQCTNTAVLDSVLVGWAGKTAPSNVKPSFSPASISTNVVQNGELEYTFSAVGTPAPTYTLSTSVSSSLYEFDNGYLYFQPTATGTYTFTCTASNSQGTATCTLTVTVTTPPPATPEVPSTPPAADTTSFTASWSAVADAASYKLYVQRKVAASTSARAARDISLLSESFEDNEIPSDWTKSGSIATASGKSGDGTYCVAFKASNAYLITPALDNPSGISFIYKRSSNTTAWELDVSVANSVDGPWTSIGTVTDADNSDWKTFSAPISLSGTVYVKFTDNRSSGTHERYVDLVQVTGASDTWEDVPGSPFTVSGTSKTISGLSAGTEYRYSVAAVNSQGVESEPSAYVTVETAEGNSAPSISVAQTSYAVTVGDPDVDFTVTVTGSPAPTVTHSCTEGAFYVFEDGEFLFTPDTVGTYHFVFTATNSEGSDSVTVTVTVSSAPITVPTLMVDDCTDTTAYAIWDECTGVTSYTLQLASDDQFTTGGSGGEVTLFSNDGTDATSAPAGWTYNVSDKTSAYLLMFSGHSVVSEAVNASGCTSLSVSLYIRTYGGTSQPNLAIQYSTDNGSTWTDAGTVAANNTTMIQRTLALPAAAASSTLRLRFAPTTTSSSIGVGIKTIVLTGTEASGSGSLISSTTVNDTEYTFTGLTPYTLYYARVKGNADWSNVAEFLTDTAGDTAPVLTVPQASYSVLVGDPDISFAVTATGTPAPTVTASCTEGAYFIFEDNQFLFEADTVGTYHFVFTATNSQGSDSKTVTVTVSDSAPVITVPQTSYSVTVGDPDVSFAVTATGAPAPTVTVTCTEGAYFIFENNEFLFEAATVGTYHFVFTASNSAGTATETVTVVVAAAPITVPVLTVTNITDTTALATWTPCEGVSTYTLQLSTDFFPAASSAARDATSLLSESFEDGIPATWTKSASNVAAASGKGGDGDGCVAFKAANVYLMTPALNNPTGISFMYKRSSNTTAWELDVSVANSTDGPWTSIGSVTDAGTTWQTFSGTISLTGTVYVKFTDNRSSGSHERYIDLVQVTGTSGGGDDPGGDDIETHTVTGTSYTFTGLTPDSAYVARVKGNAAWSEEVLFETEPAAGSAPLVRVPQTSYSVLVGASDISFAVTATGTPEPTVTATCTEGAYFIFEDNQFLFEPATIGTYHFVFTATNSEGSDSETVTVTVAGAAPSISVPQASYAVTVGDPDVGFTVNATGAPTPTVTATCTEGAFFIFENNQFLFEPDTAGTYHFVFTATNSEGSDSETVTIVVSAAPVTVPVLTVTNITDTTALATWTPCDGVSTYTLQISTDFFPVVSSVARDATSLLSESFEDGIPATWTKSASNVAAATGKGGDGDGCVAFKAANVYLMTPALNNPTGISFMYKRSSNTTAWELDVSVANSTDGPWTSIGSVTDAGTTWQTFSGTISLTGTVYVKFTDNRSSGSHERYIDLVQVTGTSGGGDDPGGDDIETYTVNGTEYTFTGLSPDSAYVARVKGNAGWSEEVVFETEAAVGFAPVWSAIPAQSVTVGQDCDLDLAAYVSGTAPITLTMADTEYDAVLVGTEFSFTPDTAGTFTFTFTAANDFGSANATLTVTATGTAPVWSAIPAQTVAVGADCDLDLAAYVSGVPTPTITMADTEYDAVLVGTEFSFTPDAPGTFTFTFTAANGVGSPASATLTVTATGDAPVITVTPATYSYEVTVGDPYVEFTVTASGNPAPSLTAACTEGAYFIFENNAFLFDPDTAGTYHFVFTATSAAGSDSRTVTVTVVEPVVTYTVSVASGIQNGSVSTDVSEAPEGDTVTVTATPADGYKLEAITVNGTPIEGNTFAMPAADVTVGATFVEKTSVTATYTVASKTNVTVTGTAPAGSSAVYAQTASQVSQATSNNTIRLTLSGYNGATITGLTLSMKSNSNKGAGSLSVTCGDAVIAGIADSKFNTANWHGAWSTNYVDVTPVVTATLVDGTVEILISATENSLYCQAFTVEYEPGTPSGDAPAWSAIPAQSVTVGQDCDLDLADYVSGTDPITLTMADTEYDALLVGTEFSFTPDTVGTFTFAFTAANDFGSSDATLTVTATGSAPVVTVTPATYAYNVTVGDPYVEFTVNASGAPAPTLTATCTEGAYFIFENNAFLFDPDTAGTYHFVFTAANSEGCDSVIVTVTVTESSGALESYVEWLERSGLDSTIPDTSIAPDGKTYEWHYITDTVPGSGQELGIVISDVSSGNFTVSAVSEFRYYQLVYTTDLSVPLESYTTVNLGWGEDVGTVSFPVEGDWYGGIRVRLEEP